MLPKGQSARDPARTKAAVSRRFTRLLVELEPTSGEVARSQLHLRSIRASLRRNFNLAGTDWFGSHAKRTAIRTYSDLDLLAKIRREELKRGDGYLSSTTLLGWVRDALTARYPNTAVGRDGLAVVVNFGSGRYAVDVVPGTYAGPDAQGRPIFHIPDGKGGWLPTSPAAHQAFFTARDLRTGGRLRRIVRLLKHWRRSRAVPIQLSSFHAEMVLAGEGVGAVPGSYSQHLAHALTVLAQRNGAALTDPVGVAHLIPSTTKPAQRDMVAAALRRDANHALLGWEAENTGNTQEALYRWGVVFNGSFPS